MDNNQVIQKAAIALADLSTAGRLNVIQSKAFIRKMQDQPTLLNQIRVVHFDGDRKQIEKIGIGTRILHGATEGTALAASKQAKPTFSKVELSTKEFIGEWEITDDTIENNIEGKAIEDTIMSIFAERAALDLEELIINGDTALSSDDFLGVLDGLRKQATSHIVDNAEGPVTKDTFKKMKKALPAKYRRAVKNLRFYVADDIEIEWQDSLAARSTQLGDAAVTTANVPPAYGIPVQGIAMLQPYTSNSKNVSDALLIHPKNVILGVSRDIRIEADRDIRKRTNFVVMTLKVDVKFEEEDAVVKATKILIP